MAQWTKCDYMFLKFFYSNWQPVSFILWLFFIFTLNTSSVLLDPLFILYSPWPPIYSILSLTPYLFYTLLDPLFILNNRSSILLDFHLFLLPSLTSCIYYILLDDLLLFLFLTISLFYSLLDSLFILYSHWPPVSSVSYFIVFLLLIFSLKLLSLYLSLPLSLNKFSLFLSFYFNHLLFFFSSNCSSFFTPFFPSLSFLLF